DGPGAVCRRLALAKTAQAPRGTAAAAPRSSFGPAGSPAADRAKDDGQEAGGPLSHPGFGGCSLGPAGSHKQDDHAQGVIHFLLANPFLVRLQSKTNFRRAGGSPALIRAGEPPALR